MPFFEMTIISGFLLRILEHVDVSVLYCIELHCLALRCVALRCVALRCVALYCIVL